MKKQIKKWVICFSFVPFLYMLYCAIFTFLPNPLEFLIHFSGYTSLCFLCASLFVQPAYLILKKSALLPFKKVLGLFSFFYALLHVVIYGLDNFSLSSSEYIEHIVSNWFVILGFLSFVILTLLALTSHKKAMKKLGYKKWKTLHKMVYISGVVAALHFILSRKGWQIEPLVFLLLVLVALGLRKLIKL